MVSRNKRIVAAFAAVAAMGMGLAGCGSDTAGDTKTTDDGGVVNITYMHRLPDSEGMTPVSYTHLEYQARRLNIRERMEDGGTRPVSTLNGTLATTLSLIHI